MLRFITAGESHGQCLTAIIEGLPAGLAIDIGNINQELARRQQGFGRGGRMQIERDTVEILSGMRFGQTLGSPLTLLIRNKDWDNWQERMSICGQPAGEAVTAARPGHADLTGTLKYERQDIRDILERASARETAARVAVGAVARQLLQACGIKIISHVTNIGGIAIDKTLDCQHIEKQRAISDIACIEPEVELQMKAAIQQAKEQGDTLGGVFEVLVTSVMPGLGSHVHWDRRLDTRLAAAVMSIPAIKGVEIGDGFAYANIPGSQAHDEIFYSDEQHYYRKSSHAGGLEGGMSNGQTLIVRAVMKPIPTLMAPLDSVDILTRKAIRASTERSDVCAVPAAAVVGEAMVAIVLGEALLEKFGGDTMTDFITAVEHYRQRIYR
jgi:chorismate synthase